MATRQRRPDPLGVILVLLLTAAVTAVLVLRFAHGPVDGRSLQSSVERVVGSSGQLLDERQRRCTAGSGGVWRCTLTDPSAGAARYAVRRTDGSCWRARLTQSSGEPMPRAVSGCVLLRD